MSRLVGDKNGGRLVKPSSKPRIYNDWRDNIDWKAVKDVAPYVAIAIAVAIVIGVM